MIIMYENVFFPFIVAMSFVSSIFLLFSALTWEEVDGTVRDKYISNSAEYLLVDYSTGETDRWSVVPEVYEDCEIGDNLHRASNGTITCE